MNRLEKENLALKEKISILENKLDIVMDLMPGGVIVTNAVSGKIIQVSASLLEMFGCDEEAFREHFYNNIELFIYKGDRRRVIENIRTQMDFMDCVDISFRVKDLMEEVRYVEYRGKRIRGEDNEEILYGVVTDITDRIAANQELELKNRELYMETQRYRIAQKDLWEKANLDAMTGHLNKAAIEKQTHKKLIKPSDKAYRALMVIDADKFKSVNDTYGHLAGDEVIKHIAGSIKKNFRDGDLVGRIGGDEFMAFIEADTKDIIISKARMINEAVREPIVFDNQEIKVSCSIGIGFEPKEKVTYGDLFSIADKALYQAKSCGGNTAVAV